MIDASQSDLTLVFLIDQYVALQPISFGGFIEGLKGQNVTRRMRRLTEHLICATSSHLSAKEQIKNFRADHADWDVAVWLDLLTVPGTPDAGPFYRELETWLFAQFGETPTTSLRVEWSKGWGYTDAGSWINEQVMAGLAPESFRPGRAEVENWDAMTSKMNAFDPNNVMVNDFLLELLAVKLGEECSGDLNSDGTVDGTDLAPLLADWCATQGKADLNGDGIVDGIDLAKLLSSWGTCGP